MPTGRVQGKRRPTRATCRDDARRDHHAARHSVSKKVENHAAAVAIHFMHYNFARPHKMLANPYANPGDGGRRRGSHLEPARDRRTFKLSPSSAW
jgi:hypothetical protein